MAHVFISYVRDDQKEVDRLCEELTKHGVNVWLDRNDIKPGVRWKDAIREAIQQGDFFIACFSKAYSSRPRTYMNQELGLAIQVLAEYPTDRTWFISVLLEECDVPPRGIGGMDTLRDIQWLELYKDWNTGIKRILDVMQPIPSKIQLSFATLGSSDNEGICIDTIRALGTYVGKENYIANRIIAFLIPFLRDKRVSIRIVTADVLRSFGDVNTIPELRDILPIYLDNTTRRYITFPIFSDVKSEEQYYRDILEEYKGSISESGKAIGLRNPSILHLKLAELDINYEEYTG